MNDISPNIRVLVLNSYVYTLKLSNYL